ncbi:MAG TPA: hypothetical protein VIC55_07120, partial [Gemmatimonadaceae bacterium]
MPRLGSQHCKHLPDPMEAQMSNTFKIIKRGLLSIAVMAALCAPASASAHILLENSYAHDANKSANALLPTYSSPTPGFQWDDAAIGAAGMLGLLGIAGMSSQ